ncbi:hypothetical protein ACLMJK_001365 [Lecanora helva]
MRTILVTDIPKSSLSEEHLTRLYSRCSDEVENVVINRDRSRLADILKWRASTLSKLERAETKLIRNALMVKRSIDRQGVTKSAAPLRRHIRKNDRPMTRLPIFPWLPALPFLSHKVDTIEHSKQQLAKLDEHFQCQRVAHKDGKALTSAFVQFKSQLAAHVAAQTLLHCNHKYLQARCVGVHPQDIIWRNVSIYWSRSVIRQVLVTLSMVLAILGWAIPVAFSGFLSEATYARTAWPRFQHILAPLAGFIMGVLPQLVLTVCLVLVPLLIRFLAGQQGFLTIQDLEVSIQRYYFTFLFVQVFLTVSVSASATTIINEIYHGLNSIPLVLANNLPKTSNYFLSYTLMQGFSISANQFAQLLGLLGIFYRKTRNDKSPRDQWQRRRAAHDVQWGSLYPIFTNLACIGRSDPITQSFTPDGF